MAVQLGLGHPTEEPGAHQHLVPGMLGDEHPAAAVQVRCSAERSLTIDSEEAVDEL